MTHVKTITFFILAPFMITLHLLFELMYGKTGKFGWYQSLWDKGRWKYLGWVLFPFVWLWRTFMGIVYRYWSDLLE